MSGPSTIDNSQLLSMLPSNVRIQTSDGFVVVLFNKDPIYTSSDVWFQNINTTYVNCGGAKSTYWLAFNPSLSPVENVNLLSNSAPAESIFFVQQWITGSNKYAPTLISNTKTSLCYPALAVSFEPVTAPFVNNQGLTCIKARMFMDGTFYLSRSSIAPQLFKYPTQSTLATAETFTVTFLPTSSSTTQPTITTVLPTLPTTVPPTLTTAPPTLTTAPPTLTTAPPSSSTTSKVSGFSAAARVGIFVGIISSVIVFAVLFYILFRRKNLSVEAVPLPNT